MKEELINVVNLKMDLDLQPPYSVRCINELLLRKLNELDQYVITVWRWFYVDLPLGLSKAETQALTNYGSGEDENEDEEIEFEEGPVDVQTSLQASSETATENEQVLSEL